MLNNLKNFCEREEKTCKKCPHQPPKPEKHRSKPFSGGAFPKNAPQYQGEKSGDADISPAKGEAVPHPCGGECQHK